MSGAGTTVKPPKLVADKVTVRRFLFRNVLILVVSKVDNQVPSTFNIKLRHDEFEDLGNITVKQQKNVFELYKLVVPEVKFDRILVVHLSRNGQMSNVMTMINKYPHCMCAKVFLREPGYVYSLSISDITEYSSNRHKMPMSKAVRRSLLGLNIGAVAKIIDVT